MKQTLSSFYICLMLSNYCGSAQYMQCSHSSCDLNICGDCLKTYISQPIKENPAYVVQIKCPSPECNNVLPSRVWK
eukprot:Awhi_evm1s9257